MDTALICMSETGLVWVCFHPIQGQLCPSRNGTPQGGTCTFLLGQTGADTAEQRKDPPAQLLLCGTSDGGQALPHTWVAPHLLPGAPLNHPGGEGGRDGDKTSRNLSSEP